jgi:hypothetical protein
MITTRNQRNGCENAARQVQNVYNDFAQLTQSYQAHDGTVNTGTTPKVQYSYADGSSNTIRIMGITGNRIWGHSAFHFIPFEIWR